MKNVLFSISLLSAMWAAVQAQTVTISSNITTNTTWTNN
ncbi:MAG: hypothetical protein RLZZ165_1181, partial [Bacteroidota bacterium]